MNAGVDGVMVPVVTNAEKHLLGDIVARCEMINFPKFLTNPLRLSKSAAAPPRAAARLAPFAGNAWGLAGITATPNVSPS